MVKRFLKDKAVLCLIVDFDKTLITCNSTVNLTVNLLKHLLKRRDISNFIFLSSNIVSRKLRLISHKKLKHTILKIARKKFSEKDWNQIAAKLNLHINPQIISMVREYEKKGYKILIASAATDLILSRFVRLEGFNFDYVASRFTENYNDYQENSGKNKLESIKQYLKKNGLEAGIVISDNDDDLPLFEYNKSGLNFLIKDKTLIPI